MLKIKALEAFAAAANGKATKIIIPSEIQGIAGLAEGVVQSVKDVPADKAEAKMNTEYKKILRCLAFGALAVATGSFEARSQSLPSIWSLCLGGTAFHSFCTS